MSIVRRPPIGANGPMSPGEFRRALIDLQKAGHLRVAHGREFTRWLA